MIFKTKMKKTIIKKKLKVSGFSTKQTESLLDLFVTLEDEIITYVNSTIDDLKSEMEAELDDKISEKMDEAESTIADNVETSVQDNIECNLDDMISNAFDNKKDELVTEVVDIMRADD